MRESTNEEEEELEEKDEDYKQIDEGREKECEKKRATDRCHQSVKSNISC